MTRTDTHIDRGLSLAAEGNLNGLKALPNVISEINTCNAHGHTMLISACRAGQLAVVKWLLDNGADPNVTNFKGTTPLMYAKTAAFASGRCDVMDALLAAGADVDAVDNEGLTALDYTRARAEFIISYLLEKGT